MRAAPHATLLFRTTRGNSCRDWERSTLALSRPNAMNCHMPIRHHNMGARQDELAEKSKVEAQSMFHFNAFSADSAQRSQTHTQVTAAAPLFFL